MQRVLPHAGDAAQRVLGALLLGVWLAGLCTADESLAGGADEASKTGLSAREDAAAGAPQGAAGEAGEEASPQRRAMTGPDEWHELHTQALLPPTNADASVQPRIRFRLRYHNPRAGEVVVVWGLDQFRQRASNLPEGTFLTYNDSHMNTPMRREGDVFVMEYETDPDMRLDYAFTVTRNAAGEEVNQWRGTGVEGEPYFHTMLTVADADEQIAPPRSRRLFSPTRGDEWHELHTQALLPPQGAEESVKPRLRIVLRYHNPQAAEVEAIWGLDRFRRIPPNLPEGTHLTYKTHMNTPMRKEGNAFVMEYETDIEARLDYAFRIVRDLRGEKIDRWRGTGVEGEPHFQAQLSLAEANETIAPPRSRRLFSPTRGDEWHELMTRALVPPEGAAESVKPRIRFQLRYHNPAAREVVVVWGLDQFRRRVSNLPEGTFLTYNDSHMNTPMRREGDVFVMEYETDPDVRLDYAFTVTRNAAGDEVNQWRGTGVDGEPYFHTMLTVADADASAMLRGAAVGKPRVADAAPPETRARPASGAPNGQTAAESQGMPASNAKRRPMGGRGSPEWHELHTTAILPPNGDEKFGPPRIRFQVRYHNPDAGEVVLVWGLNQFRLTPENLPPETFLTYGRSHMNTPLRQEGDVFVMEYETASDVRLDYAFSITRNAAGEAVKLWRGAGEGEPYFHTMLTVADAVETIEPKLELRTRALVPPDQGPDEKAVIEVQVRYRNPLATEAELIWGINQWARYPETPPKGTRLNYNRTRMTTPLVREGDDLVAWLKFPEGTRLHYTAAVTETSANERAKSAEETASPEHTFETVLSVANADEVTVQPRSNRNRNAVGFGIGLLVLFGLFVAYESRRRKRKPFLRPHRF